MTTSRGVDIDTVWYATMYETVSTLNVRGQSGDEKILGPEIATYAFYKNRVDGLSLLSSKNQYGNAL
jgi:hypothetical protein